MTDFIIYSPSYKRSDVARTHLLFNPDKFSYVVREEEQEAYRALGVKLKVIPAGAVSNIANTRNWILDHADCANIVQVDDDITCFNWTVKRLLKKLSVEELEEVLLTNFGICEDLGIKLWGMNLNHDPMSYSQNMPYSFNRPILGPFSASLGLDVRYDENLPLKEDYDLFLQVLNKHGMAMRANFLNYQCDHFDLKGGCQTYRTDEFESQQKAALQAKWGSEIVTQNQKNPDSVNMRIRL